MDSRAEVREFLRSRRARVTPAEAGLMAGGRRPVAGTHAASDTVNGPTPTS